MQKQLLKIQQKALLITFGVVVGLLLAEVAVRVVFYQKHAPHKVGLVHLYQKIKRISFGLQGKDLNKAAWEATYTDRNLPVLPEGPRDGYWGEWVGEKVEHHILGWHAPPHNRKGKLEIDSLGIQSIGDEETNFHILILGGSVAWGAYASDIEHTYFSKLHQLLKQKGIPNKITVYAAGGWVSSQELNAFLLHGISMKPNMVILLDGLNDLTLVENEPVEKLTQLYLENMKIFKMICQQHNIKLMYALQPFLPDKAVKSDLEECILKLTFLETQKQTQLSGQRPLVLPVKSIQELQAHYRQIRDSLASFEDNQKQIHFIDCSQILNAETATTYTDLWHFSDFGHELLGRHLSEGVAERLIQRKN